MLNADERDADSPLSAGALARVFPDSLCVEFRVSRQRLVELNAGKRFASALARSKDADRRGSTFAGIDNETRDWVAVLAHERDHVRRHLGTSFGLLTQMLRSRLLPTFGEMFRHRPSDCFPMISHEVRQDLYDLARQRNADKTPFASAASDFVSILDFTSAISSSLPSERFEHALSALQFLTPSVNEARAERFVQQQKWLNETAWNFSGRPLRVTAHHILEFFGVGAEGNSLLSTASLLDSVSLKLSDTPEFSDYTRVLLMWFSIVPGTMPDPFKQDKGPDELFLEWYRLCPLELYACLDLALWVPFGPSGLEPTHDSSWLDLAPGGRLTKILKGLQDAPITPSVIPSSKQNESFRDFQWKLCEQHGWPTPEDLAQKWVDSLRDHSASAFIGASPEGLKAKSISNLLSLRIQRPFDVVMNNLQFSQHEVKDSFAWLLEDDESRYMTFAPMSNDPSMFEPFYLFEGLRGLSDRPNNRDWYRLSPDVRKVCIASLDRALKSVTIGWSSEQFLASTFKETTGNLDVGSGSA